MKTMRGERGRIGSGDDILAVVNTKHKTRCVFLEGVLFAVSWLFCLMVTAGGIGYPGMGGNNGNQEAAPVQSGLDKSWLDRYRSEMKRKYPEDESARNNAVTDRAVKSMVSDNILKDKITFLNSKDGSFPSKEEIMRFSGSADALRGTSAVVVDLPFMNEVEQSRVLMDGFKEALKLYELKRQLMKQPNSIWNSYDGWKPQEAMSLYVVRQPSDIFKLNIGEVLQGGSISDFPIKDIRLLNLKQSIYGALKLEGKMVKMAIHALQNDKDFLNQAIKVRERSENLLDNENFFREKGEGEKNVDICKIDVDDNSYEWCKCDSPGCTETDKMVLFQCSKCKKINREYARKALEMERCLKEKGEEVKWFGDDAESKACKAAGAK